MPKQPRSTRRRSTNKPKTGLDRLLSQVGAFILLGTIVVSSSSAAVKPIAATTTTTANNTNIIQGSYFQPDLVADWSPTQFANEFQYMNNVKMDHAIWQWTVDSTAGHNWTYYPTKMRGFKQHNSTDAVGRSLAQAQAKGLKVWLGLNWSDEWWTKGANDPTWLNNQFAISKNVASELWSRYGSQYGGTIAGFYLTMEVDNASFDATGQDRMATVYASVANYVHSSTGKKVMVAPYFLDNAGLNPTQYGAMWGNIMTKAPIDVVAVQDGIGTGHSTLADVASWLQPLRDAVKAARPATEFWSDLETLNPDFSPAPVSRVIDQMTTERPYVDKFTSFSFNHYDSPQQGHTTEYDAWKAYTDAH
jgi:hypothetical protein